MSVHPWVKSYPQRRAPERAARPLVSCRACWRKPRSVSADRPALDFMNKRMTYAELDALANRAAAGFQKLGVGPGVHVGLFLPNTPHYVIAFFRRAEGGRRGRQLFAARRAADAPIEGRRQRDRHPRHPRPRLDSIRKPRSCSASTRLKTLIVGEFAEMTPAPEPVKAQMTAAGMLADVKHDERHIAFRDLIDNDGRYQIHPLGALTDGLAVIQYTGGTTGSPKGAMLTHANLTAACSLYTEVMTRGEQGLRVGEERFLCILPLFHIYSLTVVMLLGFRVGRGARPSSALRSRSSGQGHRRKEDHRLHGRADDACRDSQRARSLEAWIFRRCAYVRRAARPLPVAVQGAVRKRHRLPIDRRLGNDGDGADRNLQPARRRKTGPAPAGFLIPARR